MGAQVEVWFSHLPLDELDWDETTVPADSYPKTVAFNT